MKRFIIEYYHFKNHRSYTKELDDVDDVRKFIRLCYFKKYRSDCEIFDRKRQRNFTSSSFISWYFNL